MSRFVEVRNDFILEYFIEFDGDLEAIIPIDAWTTDDDSEEGVVVAQVIKTKSGDICVVFNDQSARFEDNVIEAIKEAKDILKDFSKNT